MPGNVPSAPYQVPLTPTQLQAWGFDPRPAVNPALSEEGYAVQVCNQTSVSHTLTSLSVRIASFTPSSGPVNVWHVCQDGPYDAATKAPTGGCGGGMPAPDFLAATLPSDSAGASARATANAKFNGGPDLPITIDPNKSLMILVALNGLTSQGTYTLNFDVSVDGAAPTSLAPSDGAFLIAPAATVWTGTACQAPAMQSKIPAASHDTYYVCPPAS